MNPEDILYSRVPGRVDLAGTGTDLSPYREERGGRVLSAALRIYSFARLIPRLNNDVVLRRLNDGATFAWTQSRNLPVEGSLASLQALINRMDLDRGFELHLSTDLPPGSGLAAQASMGVAALAVLEEFAGRLVEPEELARLYYTVMRYDLGKPSAQHEAYACALGGFTDLSFDGKEVDRQRLTVKESVRQTFETLCVLVSTGESDHSLPDGYEEVRAALNSGGESTEEAQHRLKANAQAARVTLAAGDLHAFANLLDEDRMDFPQLRESPVEERARPLIGAGNAAGARGGRVCGLRGNGLLFFCDDLEIRSRTVAALRNEGGTVLPFQLDELGATVWRQPQFDS